MRKYNKWNSETNRQIVGKWSDWPENSKTEWILKQKL